MKINCSGSIVESWEHFYYTYLSLGINKKIMKSKYNKHAPQTTNQNCISSNFRNNNQRIEKRVKFEEFRAFSYFERKFVLVVNTNKQWIATRASQICPAGLI